MTRTGLTALLLAAAAVTTVGCASQGHVDRLTTANRTADEQIIDLRAKLEECNARYAALQQTVGLPTAEQVALNEALRAERDAARTALADAEAKIRELSTASIDIPDALLPRELDNALQQLAAQHPGIMSYDAARGMIKFRSDLTFSPGSDQVKSGAVGTLSQLAQVVRSPAAAGYEVRIVGHTDNVPISRVKAQHPTNWHLSVHRAIGVKDVLLKAGVAPIRMSVAGYGQFRPIAANGPKGSEANRRVEIFLVRNEANAVAGAPAAGPLGQAPAGPANAVAAKQENPARFK